MVEASAAPDTTLPMTVRCWGVRGSVPTPGAATIRYGGNTSCVEVRAGSRRLILDAGTGLRLLGEHTGHRETDEAVDIFLTHFHWDHIQGFPFFGPLYEPRTTLRVVGPEQEDVAIQVLFARQMGPIYFPVPFEAVAATTSFRHLNGGEWEEDGVRVQAFRMRHPSFTVGYRVEAGGVVVCYVPDNELEAGSYAVDEEDWRGGFLSFLEGADLLLHDAMYTEEEYEHRRGWGHSTFGQALEAATDAGVKRLLFFHHSPNRTDDELDRLVERFQEKSHRIGGPMVDAGREGVALAIPEGEEESAP